MQPPQGISLDNPHDAGLMPSKVPHAVQKAGVVLFILGVVASVVFAFTEHWRRSTFTLGVAMVFLAVLRLTCDSRVMGVLAVRSRRFDAGYTCILGVVMVFLATSVDALGS